MRRTGLGACVITGKCLRVLAIATTKDLQNQRGFSLLGFEGCHAAKFKCKQAEQAAEKVGGFVGRGFSHDVSALDSSGV